MALYDTMKIEVEKLIEGYRAAVADGSLSFREAMALGVQAVGQFVRLAQDAGGTGPEKKAAVLAAWDAFYAAVIQPLDLPGPDAVVDPLLAMVSREVIGVLIDGLVALLKQAGVIV